jgi:hypothetical protein
MNERSLDSLKIRACPRTWASREAVDADLVLLGGYVGD